MYIFEGETHTPGLSCKSNLEEGPIVWSTSFPAGVTGSAFEKDALESGPSRMAKILTYRTTDDEHRVLQRAIPWPIEAFRRRVRPVLASRIRFRRHNTEDEPGHVIVHIDIRVNHFLN